MENRAQLLDHFLSTSDWRDAKRTPLAGDASLRRYERLFNAATGRRAIVMDAPPEKGENVRPFLNVAAYLRTNGLAAPEIFEADEHNGFLVLEDFGHDLFDVVCGATPESEHTLYAAAVDALVVLAQAPALESLEDFHPKMLDLALTSFRWYAEPASGIDLGYAHTACRETLAPLIASLGTGSVTSLRDFHAQNLLWLPDRPAPKNVGLLDFQDAVLGHPAYDLISLTTDARRDVSPEVQKMCVDRFAQRMSLDPERFAREAAICSVQRNLRILMIFARMSLHFGKPHYIDLIPRVWGHLMNDLAHPDLAKVRQVIISTIPAPTPDILRKLKAQCGTVSTL
ncbi:phosphotransferase [Pacificibacter sp. AS14]|uniref:aminoglycoside phosphotransferase family protein n=1 Tax=Pacificibacter sp. AS14 TaxID=3135785 RepID=UPI00317ADE61